MKRFIILVSFIHGTISTNSANAFTQIEKLSSSTLQSWNNKKNRWDVNFQSRNSPTETNPFRSSGLIARGGDGGFTSNQRTKTHMIPNDTSSIAIFSNAPFFQSLQIYTASNVIGLLISLLTKSHIHLDLIGTGAFAIASILPYIGIALQKTSSTIDASLLISSGALGRITLSTAAVTIWGTKLAGFLFYRAMQLKKDQRLVELFKTVSGTCTFWSFSLVWGILCSLPHTLGLTSSASGNIITLSTGSILYILGLVTESLADYQKWKFKSSNPGKFCNIGLWSVSQHPNYFGNLLLWTGIWVMNVPALIELDSPLPFNTEHFPLSLFQSIWNARRAIVSLLSPLFAFALFNKQASGDMLNSLEITQKRYGNDPSFALYKETVPLIFPKILPWLNKLISFGK